MNILKVWLMNKVNQIVSKIKTKLIKPFQQLQSLVHEIKISTVYTSQNTAYLYIEYKTLLFLLFGPHLNKVKSSSLKMNLSMIQTCFILYFSFISNMSNHVLTFMSLKYHTDFFLPFLFQRISWSNKGNITFPPNREDSLVIPFPLFLPTPPSSSSSLAF